MAESEIIHLVLLFSFRTYFPGTNPFTVALPFESVLISPVTCYFLHMCIHLFCIKTNFSCFQKMFVIIFFNFYQIQICNNLCNCNCPEKSLFHLLKLLFHHKTLYILYRYYCFCHNKVICILLLTYPILLDFKFCIFIYCSGLSS